MTCSLTKFVRVQADVWRRIPGLKVRTLLIVMCAFSGVGLFSVALKKHVQKRKENALLVLISALLLNQSLQHQESDHWEYRSGGCHSRRETDWLENFQGEESCWSHRKIFAEEKRLIRMSPKDGKCHVFTSCSFFWKCFFFASLNLSVYLCVHHS